MLLFIISSTSSDNTEINESVPRIAMVRHQNTVDGGETGIKRLLTNYTEQRRASVSFTPR